MEKELGFASQFVPYELAVRLKELGFKFYPLGYYSLLEGNKTIESKFYASDDFLEAPLWQQVFDYNTAISSLEVQEDILKVYGQMEEPNTPYSEWFKKLKDV